MAVALGDSNSIGLSVARCQCYKVASLTDTILDANRILNLKDRYALGEQLGWGQFGIIRECSDKLTGEVLACKSIAKNRLVTSKDVESIKLEIEIMSQLSGHPNVVDLIAVYEEEDHVHLVMELCAGGELFHQLEKRGRFSENEAKVLFRHLMQVLMYCHDNGIVHRDLKPENVLLSTKDSLSPIKLADFGLATYIKPGQSLNGTVGSPFYIAPEVLSGGYNQTADVWSAGVILYILLSGIPPFWGKTKSQIFDAVRAADLRFPSDPWDSISYSAKELIKRMLCRDPLQRPTAQQVLDHIWIRDIATVSDEPHELEKRSCTREVLNGGSCLSFMSRNQDISFGTGSPVICGVESPTFTCRSSFSSFPVEPPILCNEIGGFSFHSNGGSCTLEFSTPVLSMPSFAFCSSPSIVEKGNGQLVTLANTSLVDHVHRETGLAKLHMLLDASLHPGQRARDLENKQTEVEKVGSRGSRTTIINSRRNHTIGLGELEPLNITVTESVIRWASCTHLPTATSLRSSLVC